MLLLSRNPLPSCTSLTQRLSADGYVQGAVLMHRLDAVKGEIMMQMLLLG